MQKHKINKPALTEYPLMDEIAHRWSPRMFSSETIPQKDLLTLFEAARWAPSSNNLQPWRFIYARKGTDEWDAMFSFLAKFNQSWVSNASVLVFGIIKKSTPNGEVNFHAVHDLGLASANLSLQAQSMGIAVHQMAGIDWKTANKKMGLPEDYHIATAIAIGYYGGELKDLKEDLMNSELAERKRKSLDQIVNEGEWSDSFE